MKDKPFFSVMSILEEPLSVSYDMGNVWIRGRDLSLALPYDYIVENKEEMTKLSTHINTILQDANVSKISMIGIGGIGAGLAKKSQEKSHIEKIKAIFDNAKKRKEIKDEIRETLKGWCDNVDELVVEDIYKIYDKLKIHRR